MKARSGRRRILSHSARGTDTWGRKLLPVALIGGIVLILSLASEGDRAGKESESWLVTVIEYVATGAEVATGLVIGIAVLQAIATHLFEVARAPGGDRGGTEQIRLQLGRGLALGLEFALASDILRTSVAPTRSAIITLTAIILLRTLLNLFLEHEISRGERRK